MNDTQTDPGFPLAPYPRGGSLAPHPSLHQPTAAAPSPADAVTPWTGVPLASVGFIVPMAAVIVFDLVVVGGNSLVIAAVFTHKKQLLTVTNTFIVSLAAADLLLGLVVLPFSSANEVNTVDASRCLVSLIDLT